MRAVWTCILTVGLVVPAGCTGLFGPVADDAPQLQALAINDLTTTLRDGGILYIDGVPADTGFRLASDRRVEVQIATTLGDRERAGLYRYFCPLRERGSHFACFDFVIAMQSGADVRSLSDHVASIGGRFNVVSVSGTFAGVTLFSPNDLVERARRARSWPGVAYTELSFPFCGPGATGCGSLSGLTVPLPVDTGAAVPEDGILQVRSGDTVVVAYRQPAGGILEARRVVP